MVFSFWSNNRHELNGKEFRKILNILIHTNAEGITEQISLLCRGIIARAEHPVPAVLPTFYFRSSDVPKECKKFWTVGKKYRCPTILATSEKKNLSHPEDGEVAWKIKVNNADSVWRVNFDNETNGGGGEGERREGSEFLFAPHSPFKVTSIESVKTKHGKYHKITLKALPYDMEGSDDLPSCTWH